MKILQQWPGFANLTTEQAVALLEIIQTKLTPHAKLNGFLEDEMIYDAIFPILPQELDAEMYQRAKTKVLPNAFNRWRSVWIDHDGTINQRKKINAGKNQ